MIFANLAAICMCSAMAGHAIGGQQWDVVAFNVFAAVVNTIIVGGSLDSR